VVLYAGAVFHRATPYLRTIRAGREDVDFGAQWSDQPLPELAARLSSGFALDRRVHVNRSPYPITQAAFSWAHRASGPARHRTGHDRASQQLAGGGSQFLHGTGPNA
jgi:hypothetical protein